MIRIAFVTLALLGLSGCGLGPFAIAGLVGAGLNAGGAMIVHGPALLSDFVPPPLNPPPPPFPVP